MRLQCRDRCRQHRLGRRLIGIANGQHDDVAAGGPLVEGGKMDAPGSSTSPGDAADQG